MNTSKFTAYGLSVAVAFAAAVVLLLATAPSSASADKGVTSDAATTIDNAAAGTAVTISATHVSGKELCDEGTFAVSSAVGGTAAATVPAACSTTTTTISTAGLAADTTLTASTTGFPTSGSLIIDNDGNGDLATGAIEIVDYTGTTSTSFTGVTRAKAGTTALVPAVGANVWPVGYSQTTIDTTTTVNVNVTDASSIVGGGTVGADLILDPGGSGLGQQILAVDAISGNTLTVSAIPAAAHAVGEYVAQINGVNKDSATSLFTRTASTTTEGSFKFTVLANGETSTAGTTSLTIIADAPAAADAEVSVSATTPLPIPILAPLGGSDSTEVSTGPAWAFTALPTQGILTLPATAPICTNVSGTVAAGDVLTNCLGQVVYTPLLGATGTDAFSYTLTNGGETSAAATVTIILPGGTPTPTPGAGFGAAIVAGVNLTTYGGGTLVQLATDASAAGAVSVSVTSGGGFVVHVVGAPDFVNAAFAALFPTGVPAGTVVLVFAGS